MSGIWQDVRYALRGLRKSPGFTAIAVITLAVGIGANTALYSVINAVLLRPLPYPDAERLVWLSEESPQLPRMPISYPNFLDWEQQQTSFEHIGVYNWADYNLSGSGEPQRLNVSRVSAGALMAVDVQPALGRLFTSQEDRIGGKPVVLLSHSLWQTRFGADATVAGRLIRLNDEPYEVVGVMPAGFAFPGEADAWVPLGPATHHGTYTSRGNHPGLFAIARLKSSVSLEAARSEMNQIAQRLAEQHASNRNLRVVVKPLLDTHVEGPTRTRLWVLFGSVLMVLAIAIANVAALLLARSVVRQKEIAIRRSIGAAEFALIRQLIVESLVLALISGIAGLAIGHWLGNVLVWIGADEIPRAAEISLDGRVLLFTAGISVVAGLLFGLAPARQMLRAGARDSLREDARGSTTRASGRRLLVAGQVAFTLMLLLGSGLLLRSFYRLLSQDTGFQHQQVLTFRVNLPGARYDTFEKQLDFYRQLSDRLGSVPGVTSAAFSSQVPLAQDTWQAGYWIDGEPEPKRGEGPSMEITVASPGYFDTLGIPLVRGRDFTPLDDARHLQNLDMTKMTMRQKIFAPINVVVVDEEFERRHWGNESAVGKRIRSLATTMTVVGVVRRVKLAALREKGGMPQAYISALQWPGGNRTVSVRATLPLAAVEDVVRSHVKTLDSSVPVYDLRTLTELRNRSIASDRLTVLLITAFAIVALGLAMLGLYGVLAYAITRRTREIGIRMALGATGASVRNLVVREGLLLAGIGVVFGLAGAFAMTQSLAALLYETTSHDALTFTIAPALLLLIAVVACWIPARRAARVDPLIALRYE